MNRSMPWVRSSVPMSTVTPHTISTTFHGMRLIVSFSSAAPAIDRIVGPCQRRHPDLHVESDDDDDQHCQHHGRQPVMPFEWIESDNICCICVTLPRDKQSPSAECEKRDERDNEMREQVVRVGLPLHTGEANPFHDAVDDRPRGCDR